MHQTINSVNGSAPVEHPAAAWFDAGFTSLVPIRPGTKAPPMKGWQHSRPSRADVAAWAPNTGIGLRHEGFVFVDVDVDDPGLAAAILAATHRVLGTGPVRTGRAPRAAVLYRTDETPASAVLTIDLTGTGHKVEIRASPVTQTVVAGVHMDTGKPYVWDTDPVALGAAGLPTIDEQDVDRLLAEIGRVVVAQGGTIVTSAKAAPSGAGPVDPATLLAPDPEAAISALQAIPNDDRPEHDRDFWIRVAHAFKAAVGHDDAFFTHFDAWSQRHSSYDPAATRKTWSAIRASRTGFGDLAIRAAASGWVGHSSAPNVPTFVPVPATGTPPADPTEDGVALAFVDGHLDRVRFDHDARCWMVWDADRWRPDTTHAAFSWVRRLARGVAGTLPVREAAPLRKVAFARGVETFARADQRIATTQDMWDLDPWLAGCPGGLVDLRNGVILPPDPTKMVTKQLGARPEPMNAYHCPRWSVFLDEATGGDRALVAYLQQVAGLCLTGDMTAQLLWFIYGRPGTGKTTVLNIVGAALGDYATASPMEVFTATGQDGHPTELARLRGARLVTAVETERGRRLRDARIAEITGGDPVTARFMNKDFFTFRPQCKIILVGNHAPSISSVDGGLSRRLKIVPLDRVPRSVDETLPDQLRAELPGILGWMLEGLQSWIGGGFVKCAAIEQATSTYFAEQDMIGRWLDEHVVDVDPTAFTSADTLFYSYGEFCRREQREPDRMAAFGRALSLRGLVADRAYVNGHRVRGYRVALHQSQEEKTRHLVSLLM